MARYYKMHVYVKGEDFETKESLIDEGTFKKYQKAIEMGATHLSLPDRVIKITSIKEILPADDIVQEYLAMGVSLKQLGIEEPVLIGEGSKVQDEAKREKYTKMLTENGFGTAL